MSFKIGLVGLCTSHPEAWVPIMREMSAAGDVDVEIVAAWDSGETRPAGFAREFCDKNEIANCPARYEDMLDLVDGVIVHTTNWDKHIEQARIFVEADKSVLLDKPVAGNQKDANIILDWIAGGKRITGGSSLRFTIEVDEFLAKPVSERGRVHTVFVPCCTDEYNYGIHGYALACSVFGPGLKSARYLGATGQKMIQLDWDEGRSALMTVGKTAWFKTNMTAITDKGYHYMVVDTTRIYRSLLEKELPYFTGMTDESPLSANEFLEPELAAMAARVSWMNNGQKIFIDDLRVDDPGYDGAQFATEYRRARMVQ